MRQTEKPRRTHAMPGRVIAIGDIHGCSAALAALEAPAVDAGTIPARNRSGADLRKNLYLVEAERGGLTLAGYVAGPGGLPGVHPGIFTPIPTRWRRAGWGPA